MFQDRMLDLASLVRTSKAIRAEVECLRLQSFKIDLRLRHIFDEDAKTVDNQLRGPHCREWKMVSDLTRPADEEEEVEVDTPSQLAALVRYMAHVNLSIDFETITDGHDDYITPALSLWHWTVVDNVRCLVNALNESERKKTLQIVVYVRRLHDPEFGTFSFANLKTILRQFEAVQGHIKLDLKIIFTKEAIEDRAEQLQLKGAGVEILVSELDQDYLARLRDSEARSKTFNSVSRQCLFKEWCKLREWTLKVFGYESFSNPRRSQWVYSRYTVLNTGAYRLNNGIRTAWEAHDCGDMEKFRAAKQALYEIWRANNELSAKLFDEI